MTAPNRLRDRPLELGRGRVYLNEYGLWSADYRNLEGSVYAVWASNLPEAADWIRTKAMEATK